MKLEIGDFYVKDIVFGSNTGYKDGVLTVNKEEAAAALNPEGKLKNVDLHVARPGEKVRLLPVKLAVEPRARPDGRTTFPGFTGPMVACGDGALYALKNMSVMAIGKYGGGADGLVDMSGPAAELTRYSELINLAFTAENVNPYENPANLQKTDINYRLGAHLLAEYLGKAVLNQEPEEWERYELTNVSEKKLPKVVLIAQVSSSNYFYGIDVAFPMPTLIHPNEILDGCLTGFGAVACSSNCTYVSQNHAVLKELYARHGKDVDFAGMILSTGFEANIERKERIVIRITEISKILGCNAAIFTEMASGHNDVDFFTGFIMLEEAGIKTVGICAENPGRDGRTQPKTMLDHRVNAIVSTGSSAQAVELPAMDVIIGNIETISRDTYYGAWTHDYLLGPSLRPDGSLIVDRKIILDSDGASGWSNKTCKTF